MSPMTFALLCVVGGAGAACRFLVDALIRSRWSTHFPVATVTINLSGSFLLGVLAGLAVRHDIETAYAVLGVGFLGGFTTFSTHAVETVRLALAGPRGHAALNAFGTLIGAVLLAWLGIALGSL